ncbi:hypothetical protein JHK87_048009 [Glycine soja]|nr:hypothetical protein JHK87_048009 [Glycine soja]
MSFYVGGLSDQGSVSQSQYSQYSQRSSVDKFLHNAQMMTLGEISRLRQSGDDIKVSPPCVDELLGKTWVVRFKYRVQMRQSSVLDVTKDEYLIQTMTSTIALHVSIDYDPELFVFVTPAKRLSDQQDSSELQSDEYTPFQNAHFWRSINAHLSPLSNIQTITYIFHQCQVVGRALPTEADQHPKIYRMKLWATNEVRAKSKFWYFLRKLKKVKKSNDQVLAIKEGINPINQDKPMVVSIIIANFMLPRHGTTSFTHKSA